jgi:hypothetical protein
MKVELNVTEQDVKDLKIIRNYFGTHDLTPLEHMAYAVLDNLVKNLTGNTVKLREVCQKCGSDNINNTVFSTMCHSCGFYQRHDE